MWIQNLEEWKRICKERHRLRHLSFLSNQNKVEEWCKNNEVRFYCKHPNVQGEITRWEFSWSDKRASITLSLARFLYVPNYNRTPGIVSKIYNAEQLIDKLKLLISS